MIENVSLLAVEDYKNGLKTKEIVAKYHISTNTLSKWLEQNNVPKRTKPQVKNKDLSKFKNLDDNQLQYWMGYICADGSIQYSTDKRVYKVSLYSKDDEVIENFVNYFGENVKVINKKGSKVKEAYINSKELCEYFINELNITPNKAFTLNPNIEFSNHFILGYFDGDGCIRNSSKTTTRYESKFTSGSLSFLKKIQSILNNLEIYSIIRQKEKAYDLCIDRKADSEKLYKFMYKDHGYCLSRKLNNFVALYGNI